jgi:hypothetical protein
MRGIDIAGRQTLCNTPIDIGAKSALVEPDETTREYMTERYDGPLDMVKSDTDARFRKVVDYDVSRIGPQVAVPPTPDKVVAIDAVLGRRIHHAVVGSCASGNLADLRDAARILAGRKVHPRVRLYVTPATQKVAKAAASEGLMEIFRVGLSDDRAGVRPLRRRARRRDRRRRSVHQYGHAQRLWPSRRKDGRNLSRKPADGCSVRYRGADCRSSPISFVTERGDELALPRALLEVRRQYRD